MDLVHAALTQLQTYQSVEAAGRDEAGRIDQKEYDDARHDAVLSGDRFNEEWKDRLRERQLARRLRREKVLLEKTCPTSGEGEDGS